MLVLESWWLVLKKEEEIDFRFVRTFSDTHHKKIEEKQTNLREGVTGAGVTGAGVVGRGEGPFVGFEVGTSVTGESEGPFDGFEVGTSVTGDLLGVLVGLFVGYKDGS